MYINDGRRQRVQMTIRHYNDYRKPGNNMYIYRNDEDMTNIYDSD